MLAALTPGSCSSYLSSKHKTSREGSTHTSPALLGRTGQPLGSGWPCHPGSCSPELPSTVHRRFIWLLGTAGFGTCSDGQAKSWGFNSGLLATQGGGTGLTQPHAEMLKNPELPGTVKTHKCEIYVCARTSTPTPACILGASEGGCPA